MAGALRQQAMTSGWWVCETPQVYGSGAAHREVFRSQCLFGPPDVSSATVSSQCRACLITLPVTDCFSRHLPSRRAVRGA